MNFGVFIATLAIQEGLPIALKWGKRLYELKEAPTDAEWDTLRLEILTDIRQLDPDDAAAAKLQAELDAKLGGQASRNPPAISGEPVALVYANVPG